MKDTSTLHTPMRIEETPTSKNDTSSQVKAEVTMALSRLDNLYKENIRSYANELHSCTHALEKLHNQLNVLLKEKAPHIATLEIHEKDIDYTLRLLERLTQEWVQKSLIITELETEFKQLSQADDKHEHIISSRKNALKTVAFEIENVEISLLEHELQKQNILLLIEPIEREIKILKQSIKDLESKKRYIESTYLHQISPSGQDAQQLLLKH